MDNNVNQPVVSVIIPCYNAGNYLSEAVNSVTGYTGANTVEIIIVNDGSTDKITNDILTALATNKGFKVIHQENSGPAAARNTGVKNSSGEFLLFLDSDNKIRNRYIDIGVGILKQDPKVGVVHGKPNFFGDPTAARFEPEEFNLCKILAKNYIDMCTVIRKQLWIDLDGFDEDKLVIGHEDWDFWIRAGIAGWHFHFVNEVLYDYRILATSLVAGANIPDKLRQTHQYLHLKHFDLYLSCYHQLCQRWDAYRQDQQKPIRSFAKFSYRKLRRRPLY